MSGSPRRPLVTSRPSTTRTLDNGLRVVTRHEPGLAAVTVVVAYAAGSAHEPQGQSGLAHLCEHLLFSAAGDGPTDDHVVTIEGLGGTTNATTSFDHTRYISTVPVSGLTRVLHLEAARMRRQGRGITGQDLDEQRAVVLSERRERHDTPPLGTALEQVLRGLFPDGHPYQRHTVGTVAAVQNATLEQVRAFAERCYRPDNAVVVIAGAVPEEQAQSAVAEIFGDILPGAGPADGIDRRGASASEQRPDGTAEVIEQAGRLPIPVSVIGHRIPPDGSAQWPAALVWHQLLAGGRSGRLARRLEREQGIAAATGVDVVPLVRDDSVALVSLLARTGVNAEQIAGAYRDELHDLAEAGPDSAEMGRAQAHLYRIWGSRRDTLSGLADELAHSMLFFDEADRGAQAPSRLAAVRSDDIREMVGSWIERGPQVHLNYQPEDRS